MNKSSAAAFFAACLLLVPIPAVAGGSLVGLIRYEGEAPLAKRRPITVDSNVCGPEAVTEDLVLGKMGAIQGVVVSLAGTVEGAVQPAPPPEGYVLDERSCRLNPHIVAIPAGASLKILNSDHLNHFYRIESRTNPPSAVALPRTSHSATLRFDFPEIMEVHCEVHDWERARIVVMRNPYVAITDAEGKFEIKDIPVGDYTVAFWQEVLGPLTRRIQIREGEPTRINLILGPRKESSFPMEPNASLSVSRLDVNILPIITVR